jgi:hypothetical protein
MLDTLYVDDHFDHQIIKCLLFLTYSKPVKSLCDVVMLMDLDGKAGHVNKLTMETQLKLKGEF